jgi:hypothetical protein
MNDEKPSLSPEADTESKPLNETEMANLTLNLQKIEGYEPATIEASKPPVVNELPVQPSDINVITAKKSGKKKWIIGAILASVLIVLGVGGWAAYAFWYQNPDKIITDALYNTMLSKTIAENGSLSISSSDGTSSVFKLQGKGGYKEGGTASIALTSTYADRTVLKLGLDASQTSKGDYYFKLSNLQNAYKTYLDQLTKSEQKDGYTDAEIKQSVALINGFVKPYIDKLDSQWVRFAMTDINKYDKTLEEVYTCENKLMTDVANDDKKTQLIEMAKLYQKYKIIVFESNLGTKDGNIGLLVHVDQHELKSFINDLGNTAFVKAFKACNKSKDSSSHEAAGNDTPNIDFNRLELWVDQWSHALKRIYTKVDQTSAYDSKNKTTYTADFGLESNVPVSVQTPTGSKSIDELFPDLANLFKSVGANQEDSQSYTPLKDTTQSGNI